MSTKISGGTVISIETVVSGIDQEFIPEGTAPVISGVESSYTIGSEQTINIVATAYDADGDDITWSYSTSGDLGGTTVAQNDNVFTVTGGQQDATFTITITATDSAGWVVSSTTTAYYDYLEPPQADGNNFFVYAHNADADNPSNAGALYAFDDAGTPIYTIAAPAAHWGFNGPTKNSTSIFVANSDYAQKGRIWKYDLLDGGNGTLFYDNTVSGNDRDYLGREIAASDTHVYALLGNWWVEGNTSIVAIDISTGDITNTTSLEFNAPYRQQPHMGDNFLFHDDKLYVCHAYHNQREGAVYVYDENLTLLNVIIPPSGQTNPSGSLLEFGDSLAISDGNLYVGARYELGTNGRNYAGAVYVFNMSDYSYSYKIVHPVPTESANFGRVVSADNGYLVVGAPDEYNNETHRAGGAYLYTSTGTLISELEFPTGYGTQHDSLWGQSLAIAGDRIMVGARKPRNNDGLVALFDNTGTLLQVITPTGAGNLIYRFGFHLMGQTT